jgi:pilus assembly protein CpaF
MVGVVLDNTRPLLDARLPDGTRFNIVLPPVAEGGPHLAIRKFFRERMEPEDLTTFGTWNQALIEFLNACVAARLNMILSGSTGSGKTTLLNVVASAMLPEDERIVVLEEREDIQLPQKYVVTLATQPSDAEGRGEITLAELIRNATRMRADRLVIGEIRGPEAFELIEVMNSGQDGTLFTIHASSARDSLTRLETMANLSNHSLTTPAIREFISAAVDLVVHLDRMSDGRRRITTVTEVRGMQGDEILTEDLFIFAPTEGTDGRVDGSFTATGHRPSFLTRIEEVGIELDPQMFVPPSAE